MAAILPVTVIGKTMIPYTKPDSTLIANIRRAIDSHRARLNRRVVAARSVA